jgi:hypothetical protein
MMGGGDDDVAVEEELTPPESLKPFLNSPNIREEGQTLKRAVL